MARSKMKAGLLTVFITAISTVAWAQLSGGGELNPDLSSPQAAQEEFMDWRIGLSVHWGPSSRGEGEISWSRGDSIPREVYDNFYREFNPEKFDADEWAALMKRWGVRYMAPTGKHHDGFTLWFSDCTEYDMENAQLPIDLMAEWSRACRANGIAFGSYYSNLDWYHPDWTPQMKGGPGELFEVKDDSPNLDRYFEFMECQVLELINRYDVAFIQFDGEWDSTYTHEMGSQLYRTFREADEDILLSTRIDKGRTYSDDHINIDGAKYAGDYQERERIAFGEEAGNEVFGWADHPWQAWVTIDKGQWSYRPNPDLMTIDELILDMISALGNNGNYMINLGPRPDGTFDPEQVELMDQLGEWLRAHADGIYGTRGGPYYPYDQGFSTRRGNQAWLYLTDTAATKFTLAQLDQKLQQATVFGTDQTVSVTQNTDSTLTFDLPKVDYAGPIKVIELSYEDTVDMEARHPEETKQKSLR